MQKIPAMVDMRRTPAEKQEVVQTMAPTPDSVPDYPWGLSICLCDDELQKLGLDALPEVGDMLHIHAMAKVTSVSSNDTGSGPSKRVELQITHMVGEDEDDENSDYEPAERRTAKLYGRS